MSKVLVRLCIRFRTVCHSLPCLHAQNMKDDEGLDLLWSLNETFLFRPIRKIPMFRVTRLFLNLLVKPRIFFRFSGKNIIFAFQNK